MPTTDVPCFYCGGSTAGQNHSREHCFSQRARAASFGPIAPKLRAFRGTSPATVQQHNQIPVVEDVCRKCNNARLQPYDVAGKKFAEDVDKLAGGDGASIYYSQDVIGFLLKTHLNYLRWTERDPKSSVWPFPFDKQIVASLRDHLPVPPETYRLYIEGWSADGLPPEFWKEEIDHPAPYDLFYVDVLGEVNIVASRWRIKWLETLLLLPRDGDYTDFDDRCAKVVSYFKGKGYEWQHLDEPLPDLAALRIVSLADWKSVKPRIEQFRQAEEFFRKP